MLIALECSSCGSRHDAGVPANLSPCGVPLLARYDLGRVRAAVTREEIAARPHGLWRCAEPLAVGDPAHRVTLGEGDTPLPVAARSSGCAPVVAAFEAGKDATEAWPEPVTAVYGITVAAPLGGPLILRLLRESLGTAVADGWIAPGEQVVVPNTGSPLVQPEVLP